MNSPRDKVKFYRAQKSRLLKERGAVCERCGFSKFEILVIHHIDRDRVNNNLDNLELICPNCHSEEHLKNKNLMKSRKFGEIA